MTINDTMAELIKLGAKGIQLDYSPQGEAHASAGQQIETNSGKGTMIATHHGIGADHEFALSRVLDQCKHVAELRSNIVSMGNGR